MKLKEKICSSKISYLIDRRARKAFRLALLYYILAKRKSSPKKIVDTLLKAVYWLKRAKIQIPASYKELSPAGLLIEIEKLLVSNKITLMRASA